MSGTYHVQAEVLRKNAGEWDSRRDDVQAASGKVSPGVGMGEKFGYLAGANQVTTYYNKWSNAMAECLRDANECFSSLSSALISAANTYDAADASSAAEGSSLESRLGGIRSV